MKKKQPIEAHNKILQYCSKSLIKWVIKCQEYDLANTTQRVATLKTPKYDNLGKCFKTFERYCMCKSWLDDTSPFGHRPMQDSHCLMSFFSFSVFPGGQLLTHALPSTTKCARKRDYTLIASYSSKSINPPWHNSFGKLT